MPSLSQFTLNQKGSGIRVIMNEAFKMEGVLHLEVGEPLFSTPEHIKEAAAAAASAGFTKYTPNAGYLSLQNIIVKRLEKDYGLKLKSNNIVVTVGGVGALFNAVRVIADPGDEILIPDPGWPNYEMIVSYAGASARRYRLLPEKGYLPSPSEIEASITAKTKAIIINTPSNPLGVVYPGEVIKELVHIARKKDIYLLSDEVYEKITFENKHSCAASYDTDGRVISVFSFSKTYAMTGWRLGYAVCEETVAKEIAKCQEAYVSCAPSISQKAAEAAITGPQQCVEEMRQTYQNNLEIARAVLDKYGIEYFVPQGAFYMWINAKCNDSDQFAKEVLLNNKVAVAPGNTFSPNYPGYIRISLASPANVITEGLEKIAPLME